MFSLIITIISIALVAALAVASVYYGGQAFSQGTAKANASTLVSQAQQIAGANTLYANDHNGSFVAAGAVTGSALTPDYLSSAPVAKADLVDAQWQVAAGNVVTIDLDDGATEVAAQIRLQAGQAANAADLASATTQFGVIEAAGGDLSFFYKG